MRYRASVGPSAVWRPAVLGALAAALLVSLALTGTAAAQERQALVRFAHLSMDADTVDVYVDGERALPGVKYKGVSQYMELPPGRHDITTRPAGAGAGAAPLATLTQQFRVGASTVGLFGPDGGYELGAYTDDLSAPPSGQVKLRALHAGIRTNAQAVDVYIDGRPAFTDLSFMEATDYLTAPGGTFSAEVRAAGTDTVLVAANQVVGRPGAVVTFAGVGSGDTGYEFLPILDAVGAGTLPRGGVATGAGGTATPTLPVVALVGAGALVGFATLATALRRRHAGATVWRG